MSLNAVLNSARSSLASITGQTRAASENISNADNPDYSRRIASPVASGHGILRLSVRRAQDRDILSQMLDYTSRDAANSALREGLGQLERVFGGPDSELSPAALITRLQSDLQAFAAMPDNAAAATQTVESARAIVQTLNRGAESIVRVRQSADEQIAASVARINGLLRDFHEANAAIVTGRLTDAERIHNEERRDQALTKLAEELDIRTVQRNDGGLAIYTGSGAVLYERGPREVRFQPSATLPPGAPGGQIFIDNIPVTGGGAIMRLTGGRLAGLVRLRDDDAAAWGRQLDEIARGLVGAFAEHDASGANPDAPGLFTWSGAPAMPPDGVLIPGFARGLRLNAAADPQAGGDPFLVRDGGMNGAAYVANTTGAAGFTDRLLKLDEALRTPRAFDAAAGLRTSASLGEYAGSSVSWLEDRRARTETASEHSKALLTRASDALSRATGVDLDDELAVVMRLERSYEATARIITTVDRMLGVLMNSMR